MIDYDGSGQLGTLEGSPENDVLIAELSAIAGMDATKALGDARSERLLQQRAGMSRKNARAFFAEVRRLYHSMPA